MGHLHDDVIRTVSDKDVRFIRLWFSDIVGTLKSIAISPADLEIAFTEGIGIDGSTIEGLTRSYESDMILRPDPATFELLAWRGETNATGRMMCDVLTPDGEPARTVRAVLGADAVGMSTVPEIILGRFLGLRCAAVSVITNMGAGLSTERISHDHTKQMAPIGAEKLERVLRRFLRD